MKYAKEKYLNSGIWDDVILQADAQHLHNKLVKIRKEHDCLICHNWIQIGDMALNTSAWLPHEGGWNSWYTCTGCIERFIEDTHQVPITYQLKILPKYFEAVKAKEKNFEIRKYERNYMVGDSLVLAEWDGEYTGRRVLRKISYVLTDCPEYGLMDGYCILGF